MTALPQIAKHKSEAARAQKAQSSPSISDNHVTGNFYHGLVNGLAISMVLWGFIILGICWVVM